MRLFVLLIYSSIYLILFLLGTEIDCRFIYQNSWINPADPNFSMLFKRDLESVSDTARQNSENVASNQQNAGDNTLGKTENVVAGPNVDPTTAAVATGSEVKQDISNHIEQTVVPPPQGTGSAATNHGLGSGEHLVHTTPHHLITTTHKHIALYGIPEPNGLERDVDDPRDVIVHFHDQHEKKDPKFITQNLDILMGGQSTTRQEHSNSLSTNGQTDVQGCPGCTHVKSTTSVPHPSVVPVAKVTSKHIEVRTGGHIDTAYIRGLTTKEATTDGHTGTAITHGLTKKDVPQASTPEKVPESHEQALTTPETKHHQVSIRAIVDDWDDAYF